MRRLTAAALTFLLFLAAPAAAGGPNQVVTASPRADGAQIHRSAVKVTSTAADSITSTNLARATPRDCTGCEGIAVSFQAIIATGDPSDVRPTNAAVAVNSECTSCNAFAYAYQYVVSADRGVTLSADGRAEVRAIRAQAADLVDAGLSNAELDRRLDALAADFKAAVADDLANGGGSPHGGKADAKEEDAPAA